MAQANDAKKPLLKDKTPTLNYTKRYDQVSWRSADTDFEVDPSASSADEHGRVMVKNDGKCPVFCTRRYRKLIALVIVVVIFLIIMSGLIYLYYSKSSDQNYVPTPAVLTDCGEVSGIVETSNFAGKDVKTFLFKGIPYAKPPIGNLRWSAPISLRENPSQCWKGKYEATTSQPVCVQTNKTKLTGSEDCLYLNVYTPSLSSVANLPVFVWIYGGSLITGNKDEYGYSPNSEFVNSMGVVAVSMNYRLNAFGFLTLEELWQKDESYGNYGFMDQILALKWIQKNIKNFGGDPNSVTICGQSSGGTSIFGLLASPMADGLFNKAIPMSGSPKFEKSYVDAAIDNRIFVNKTKCSELMSKNERRKCLFNLTIAEVTDAIPYIVYPSWLTPDLLDFPTKGLFDGSLPVIDPIVVPKPPKDLKDFSWKGKSKVSVLLGSTAQEIGFRPAVNFNNKSYADYKAYLKNKLDKFSPTFLNIVLDDLYKNITSNLSSSYAVEYIHETITSDVRVNCPSNQLAKDFALSDHHNIYRYVVTATPSRPIPLFGFPSRNSFHAWDSIALFDFKMVQKFRYEPTSVDLKFQKSLRENIKHFMMFGHLAHTDWETGNTGVFNNKGDVTILSKDYHEKQCKFWDTNGFVPYAWLN